MLSLGHPILPGKQTETSDLGTGLNPLNLGDLAQ